MGYIDSNIVFLASCTDKIKATDIIADPIIGTSLLAS